MDVEKTVKLPVAKVDAETPKAWKIKLVDGTIDWFPKSQCRLVGKYLHVPQWLAEKKELEDDAV